MVTRDAGIDVVTRKRPPFSLETMVSHLVVSTAASQFARSVETAMDAGTPAYTSR
jgi:hypothetical protein